MLSARCLSAQGAVFVALCLGAAAQQAPPQDDSKAAGTSATTPGEQSPAPTQASDGARLDKLEAENAELRRRIDLVAADIEGFRLGDVITPLGVSEYGMGPAASKVYEIEQGLSIGGYGEIYYSQSDTATDTADALRGVFYFGYRFDDKWLVNTEIELEHAEEAFLEFAYVDYLASEEFNVRAGLLLAPMGFLNELHEPTSFYGVLRPGVETYILPTTFRENGAGVHGELGDFVYRAYVLNGFDAEGFTAEGLRKGRQKGSETLAEDLALTARLDWMGLPGTTVGASTWLGDSGQGQVPGTDVGTAIVEGHVEWRWRGLRTRLLYAQADLGGVADLNADLGLAGANSVGERLDGWYVEAAYDLMGWLNTGSKQQLAPYVRWETFNTQVEVPVEFASNPANDVNILTVGLDWKPNPHVVFKTDLMQIEDAAGNDETLFNIGMGYVF